MGRRGALLSPALAGSLAASLGFVAFRGGPGGPLRKPPRNSPPLAGLRAPATGRPPLARVRAAEPAEAPAAPKSGTAFINLPTLFVSLLVIHKCVVDGLSRHTRIAGVPYSAATAAFLGECVKAPVLLAAILIFEGRGKLGAVFREAVQEPFSLAFPALCYSIQNVLYFQALSHLSVATYQILSQSKLIFTAFLMVVYLKKKLGKKQYVALLLLILGTIFTQLSEIPRNKLLAGSTGNPLYGGLLAVLGALFSAFPNVHYEKVLKTKDKNQWASNIQITFWIWFWLVLGSLPSFFSAAGSAAQGGPGIFAGIQGWVWVVIWLQSLKCVLIPATLKYSDNIVYAYAKPLSIVATAVISAVVSGLLPSGAFLCGAALVMASMILY